ncbi:hypothetical protein R0137_14395 [Congregibacter brevis]|uniref:Uncharacterized protein n=1 Tax=Congregibacter brevis TaxID=3081201 RepID=A0ABZ0IBB9_9GAMM|nr:hypothetical protein R0137_14395 [Congregibacter sp. IMCC45268]
MSASQEINRLRYLAAMGVPAYVARRPLPGAAVSAKYALRIVTKAAEARQGSVNNMGEVGAATSVKPSKRSAGTPPAAQALRESLQQDTGRRRAPQTETVSDTSTTVARSAASLAQIPRFRLAAMIIGKRLWLEELGDEALAQDQLQLISAMSRALSHPAVDEDAVAVTEFRWPLHDNAQLGLGSEDAAATLQGFLYRQLEENACVELISLGDASKALLMDLSVPCARRFVPSTREMLKTPLLKREVWNTLRV